MGGCYIFSFSTIIVRPSLLKEATNQIQMLRSVLMINFIFISLIRTSVKVEYSGAFISVI